MTSRILLVDDNHIQSATRRAILEVCGREVCIALEGQQALEAQPGRRFIKCGDRHRIVEDVMQPAETRGARQDIELGGEQPQIVAFARAMSSFPALLLLDEPFLGLAPVWIARISDAIRQMQQRGTTILMTEQMARPALKLATRGYVMRGGEICRGGTVAEVRDLALAAEYL